MNTLEMVIALMVVYQFKHLICDYLFQGYPFFPSMNLKFSPDPRIASIALAKHCSTHFIFTFVIAGIVSNSLKMAVGLSVIDFVSHFIMDLIKANPSMLGRYKPMDSATYYDCIQKINSDSAAARSEVHTIMMRNTYFWWSLGLDQTVHHLIHILIVFMLVR